jgi:hypothetical protein
MVMYVWCQIMKMSLCGSCVLWPHYMSVILQMVYIHNQMAPLLIPVLKN